MSNLPERAPSAQQPSSVAGDSAPRSLQVLGRPVPMDLQAELQKAEILYRSGFFPDIKSKEQAAAKIIAGVELGIGAVQALRDLYIVKGRVTMAAVLMAALLRRSGYDYQVEEITNSRCAIRFHSPSGRDLGLSSYTLEDAKITPEYQANPNYKAHPRNMLFSRAMSNGIKWFAPDAVMGSIYTPDELGAQVTYDPQGNILDVKPDALPPANPEDTPDYEERWERNAEKYRGLIKDAVALGLIPETLIPDWSIATIQEKGRELYRQILAEQRARASTPEPPEPEKTAIKPSDREALWEAWLTADARADELLIVHEKLKETADLNTIAVRTASLNASVDMVTELLADRMELVEKARILGLGLEDQDPQTFTSRDPFTMRRLNDKIREAVEAAEASAQPDVEGTMIPGPDVKDPFAS